MKSLLTLALAGVLFLSCNDREEPLSEEMQALIKVIETSRALEEGLSTDKREALLYFQPFQNPPEERSVNGKLVTKLNVEFATNKVFHLGKGENVDVYHRSYNGRLVGATWRIKKGDRLRVDVKNQLAQRTGRCDPMNPVHDHSVDHNVINPARFNTTNLHVHGFHVSPSDSADNVFIEIEPGCNFQNVYDLPDDHAQGTFWYHGHVHGSTAIQVASGMAGAIIIEGGLDEQPQIKAMEEKIMVLQQMPFMEDTANARYHVPFDSSEKGNFGPRRWHNNAEKQGWSTTINGQTIPVLTMAPGEVQRWRFVHAGVRETVNLHVISQEITKHHESRYQKLNYHVIAEDGIAYGRRDERSDMKLQPGYRADILVKAPEMANGFLYLMDGESDILTARKATNEKEEPKLLAIVKLVSKGPNVAKKLPSQASLSRFAPYPSLVNEATTVDKETMRFNIRTDTTPTQFQIDGIAFDPKNIRCLKKDAVQDWHLTSGRGSHPFHIHVNHFQILGKLDEDGQLEPYENPIWKDTYMVEKGKTTVIRTVYKNFTGKFVIHCHILDHEDQGMMQSVQIVEQLKSCPVPPAYTAGITECGPEENSVQSVPPD